MSNRRWQATGAAHNASLVAGLTAGHAGWKWTWTWTRTPSWTWNWTPHEDADGALAYKPWPANEGRCSNGSKFAA